MPRRFSVIIPCVAFLLVFAVALTGAQDEKKQKKMKKEHMEQQTIAEIAAGNESFSTLVAALEAAGLVETFQGKEHYTVFAPTNEAFARALEDLGMTAEELLGNKDLLTSILLYHVAKGDRYAKAVLSAGKLKMLDGNFAEVTTDEEGAYIDGCMIVKTDIKASNGVVHVIDYVMLPPEEEKEK